MSFSNLFDAIVDPQSLGGARNVKKYRDWIVHRNPRKGEPEKVDAKTARKAFSDIITAIRAADSQAQ